MATRLGSDGYKRPKHTYQDKLTDEEIADKLRFYKKVENIIDVPLSTHLRYFLVSDNGETKFRMGGMLQRADGLPKYVVLSNGNRTWSVQVNNTVFFQKMTMEELGEKIDALEEKNNALKKLVKEYKEKLNNLEKRR